jgi:hypothetical protein
MLRTSLPLVLPVDCVGVTYDRVLHGAASRPGCLPSGITSVRRPRVMPDGQPRAGQVSTSANAKALKLVVEGA